MKFCFGDIVIVEKDLIGVVVKSFGKGLHYNSVTGTHEVAEPYHQVYVRSFNGIKEYTEDQMERYMVRHKELNEEELEWQYNAVNGL